MTRPDEELTEAYLHDVAEQGGLREYADSLRKEVIALRARMTEAARIVPADLVWEAEGCEQRPAHVVQLLERARAICDAENIDVGLDPTPEFAAMVLGPDPVNHGNTVTNELVLMAAMGVFAKDVYFMGQYDGRTHGCWPCIENDGSKRTYTREEFHAHTKTCVHSSWRKVLAVLDRDDARNASIGDDNLDKLVEIRAIVDAWFAS